METITKPISVKRFRQGEPIADTELRFLQKGDVFWYEKNGKPQRLPKAAGNFKDINTKSFYLVAATGPIWARERSGKRKFVGIKFREASELELRLLAFAQTEAL